MRRDFAFSGLGGYYVLLAFLPARGPARDGAVALLEANRALFDANPRVACGVIRDEADFLAQRETRGLPFFYDEEGASLRDANLRYFESPPPTPAAAPGVDEVAHG